jgi:hypothetical protein
LGEFAVNTFVCSRRENGEGRMEKGEGRREKGEGVG